MNLDALLRDMRDEAADPGARGRAQQAFWAAVSAEFGRLFDRGFVRDYSDDLTQNALMVVMRKLGDFEPRGPNSVAHWLSAIAVRELRNKKRALAKQPEFLAQLFREPSPPDKSPSTGTLEEEQWKLIEEHLPKLRTREREALAHEDLAALAEHAGISLEAARQRWKRALKNLAKRIDAARKTGRVRVRVITSSSFK